MFEPDERFWRFEDLLLERSLALPSARRLLGDVKANPVRRKPGEVWVLVAEIDRCPTLLVGEPDSAGPGAAEP